MQSIRSCFPIQVCHPVVRDEIDPTHLEEVRGQFVPLIFGQAASVLGRRGRLPRPAIPEQGSLLSLT